MTTWEPIWKRRQLQNGFAQRIGRKLAVYGDLQRLVLGVLKRNFPINRSTRILEVGCGSGPVAGSLTRLTPWVYGVDISPVAVALTKSRGVEATVADAGKLPFSDETFSLVYTTGVVDLFDDLQAAQILEEIVRVTETGGRAVLITAWSGCGIHEAVKRYLVKKNRWRYGPKRTFSTLENLLPRRSILISEQPAGALFQFRFLSYLFERCVFVRRSYHLVYLLISIALWPLNRLPGGVLVTIMEKK